MSYLSNDGEAARPSEVIHFKCDNCSETHFDPDYFHEHKPTGQKLCPDCFTEMLEFDREQEERNSAIIIKVEESSSWWGKRWMAYSEELGGIDFSCENGEDWTSCGSPIGEGSTIQEAIEDFLEKTDTEKFVWA